MADAAAPKALPQGAPLWWARLFAFPERRPAVDALLAVRGELVAAAQGTSDPGVAGAKLAWWREEIRRFGSGAEQHPSTRALAAADGGREVEPEYLEELLDGAEMDAAHRPYGGFSELRLYCHRSSGILQELLAAVIGTRAPTRVRDVRNAAHGVGIGVRLAEIAWSFREDLEQGRIYLPGDWLEETGVSNEALAAEHPDPALVACLTRLAGEARRALHEATNAWPAGERGRHRHALVLAELAGRRLARAEARGWRVRPRSGRGARACGTLGDLATAWRAARRAVMER